MEDAGPQVADNATGISAEIAEDGTVSAETSGLVAPRKDGPARALQKWLGRMLEMKPRACSGMARQLLSGLINDSAPTSVSIRSLCRDPDPEKALRFFSALKIDDHTARQLLSRCRLPFGSRTEGSSRKRRHESDADSSGDDNALVDDSASPQLLATLRSEDASAQLEKTDCSPPPA